MPRQTAVEWLAQQLYEKMQMQGDGEVFNQLLNQAKTMEKEQIVDACNLQRSDYRGMPTYNKSGEEYYNETYKGGNNV